MSNHRENALAFGLSRALALLEKVKTSETAVEVETFTKEMHQLLAGRRTLRDPARALPSLQDVAVLGEVGKGWLVNLLTVPTSASHGKVTFCISEDGGPYTPTAASVLFQLVRDPTVPSEDITANVRQIAHGVASFVELTLATKGLTAWAADNVIMPEQSIDGIVLNAVDYEC